MRLIKCLECGEGTGSIDPLCPMCDGSGEIGLPDDEETDTEEYIEGYELRPAFQKFVATVQAIVGPLLLERGYAATAQQNPRNPDPTFSKPWRNARYPDQQWHLLISYEYDEHTEILNHREFSINVYRALVERQNLQAARDSGVLHSPVSYTEVLWIPEYLNDMVWGYTPLGADPPIRTHFPHPRASWYYRTSEELQHVLAVGAKRLPAYLDWLEDPEAARSPKA